MTATYMVRKAGIKDIEAISAVQIQSWKETYPGIMPQKKLDGMSMERSSRHWQAIFCGGYTVLAAETEGRVVGFAAGGKKFEYQNCETGLANACDCELEALYLLKEFHSRGMGKALFHRFADLMRQEKKHVMTVWVAEKNPSTGFYEAMGGELVDRMALVVCKVPVPAICYRFTLGIQPV